MLLLALEVQCITHYRFYFSFPASFSIFFPPHILLKPRLMREIIIVVLCKMHHSGRRKELPLVNLIWSWRKVYFLWHPTGLSSECHLTAKWQIYGLQCDEVGATWILPDSSIRSITFTSWFSFGTQKYNCYKCSFNNLVDEMMQNECKDILIWVIGQFVNIWCLKMWILMWSSHT